MLFTAMLCVMLLNTGKFTFFLVREKAYHQGKHQVLQKLQVWLPRGKLYCLKHCYFIAHETLCGSQQCLRINFVLNVSHTIPYKQIQLIVNIQSIYKAHRKINKEKQINQPKLIAGPNLDRLLCWLISEGC